MRFTELSLSAQTAYAELFDQTRSFELTNALAGLRGTFHKMARRNQSYWYFAYRDLDQKVRTLYVGPDSERVRDLVEQFEATRVHQPLAPLAQSALALGCEGLASKHFRIIKRLSEYGFFRAGGVLVGTHAFAAMGNMLGIRWGVAARTLDVDFAHAGRNISVALPANIHVNVHDALTSLEMGLLPMTAFNGKLIGQYRNPRDQELRLDFLTTRSRDDASEVLPALNIALQPLPFMEMSLEGTVQACVFSKTGSCVVNIPAAQRYAIHKLIVYGERPESERTKANKDLLQAAAITSYFLENGQSDSFLAAWTDAIGRGKGWRKRAEQGRVALLRLAPEFDRADLWGTAQ